MIAKDRLLLIFTEEQIDIYLDNNDISVSGDSYKVLNNKLLLYIISSFVFYDINIVNDLLIHINNKTDFLYIKFLINLVTNNLYELNYDLKDIPDDYNFVIDFYKNIVLYKNKRISQIDFKCSDKYIILLKNFLENNNYMIASELSDMIYIKTKNPSYLALKYICLNNKDKITYINDCSSEECKKMERMLCIYTMLDPLSIETTSLLDELSWNYQKQNLDFFVNENVLYDKLRTIMRKHSFISSRGDKNEIGEYDSIIWSLLNQNDFYRLSDVVNNYNNGTFSIKNNIYKSIVDLIIKYNNINRSYIKKTIELSSIFDDKYISRYHFPSISSNIIYKKNEKNTNNEIWHNYFNDYKEYFDLKEYKKALESINRFKRSMDEQNIFVNISHYVNELLILIYNIEENDYLNVSRMDEYMTLGLDAYNNDAYEKSIEYNLKSLEFMKIENPTVLSYIAKAYYKLGDFDNALKYFELADKEYVYPEDYLVWIDCLYEKNILIAIPIIAYKYESFNKDENVRLHYLLSIVYAKCMNYKFALKELEKCESISNEILNLKIKYSYEKDIIRKLQSGEQVELYTINDFVDFTLSKEETIVMNYIIENQCTNEEIKKTFIEPKTISIFGICKILTILGMNDRIQNILDSIGVLKDKQLTYELKNYKNL